MVTLKKTVWLILFYSVAAFANVKDLGTFGETFPVQEDNLLSFIQNKLARLESSGALLKHQNRMVEQLLQTIQKPKMVEGIMKTKEPRRFYYDPSITVPYDLKDHQGIIFHKAGTRLNPLEFYSLKSPLLFIDGEDVDQVDWAKSQEKPSKIILVKGSPFELMKAEARLVYFDQGGSLVKKLGIQQVPARVDQQDKKLVISEISLEKSQ